MFYWLSELDESAVCTCVKRQRVPLAEYLMLVGCWWGITSVVYRPRSEVYMILDTMERIVVILS